ncbi:hypothetical protein ACFW5X_32785 [Streptomyces albogriseolus]|uniref:hypothetical protein n=1 Tax=Streptomyces TaxID=1883 RepID=UPI001F61D822|nr:hypothetical protein [Streptomyces sp. MMS20-AI2-20]MCI4146618.1 hypothetical protein [Streptomyces sp. MMS20-AI2-20]
MPERLKVDHHHFAAGEQGLITLLEGLIKGMRGYVEDTRFSPADPPWATDEYGKKFEASYLTTQKSLAEAISSMQGALANVVEITEASRRNYLTAQNDAVTTVGNQTRRS